jgi:hypothetical protein
LLSDAKRDAPEPPDMAVENGRPSGSRIRHMPLAMTIQLTGKQVDETASERKAWAWTWTPQ